MEPARLFGGLVHRPYFFWLDSSLPSERSGRFSFMGADPFLILRSRSGKTDIVRDNRVQQIDQDPIDALAAILKTHRPMMDPCKDIPFPGGGVGYLGYDLGRLFERLPDRPKDDLGLPDMHVAFYGAVIVFDHMTSRISVCGFMEDAVHELQGRFRRIAAEREQKTNDSTVPGVYPTRSNFSRHDYLHAVLRVKDYIASGDVYQVNLSQRFHTRLEMSAQELYLRLRRHNPAPFSAYLDLGDAQILSSSPERFLRVLGKEGVVETRPIKGTRGRGETEEEDIHLAEELLQSEKDRAELVMIVDLERNDLGRVCGFGSVRVPELASIEPYASVYHLVATVTGELPPDRDIADLIRATFPGGSITGAPKLRAMEIIDELEPVSRGPYTGALGYFSFSGDLDLNILIRSLVVKGNQAFFHAGGGIVADSDAEKEYMETLHKVRGMMGAVGGGIVVDRDSA